MEKKNRKCMTDIQEVEYIKQLADVWYDQDVDPITKTEVRKLVESKQFDILESRLCERIEFGTAGLRGKMEAGYNRMNYVTVYQASLGLADYVKSNVKDAESRGIAIGHDHRHNSSGFAEIASLAFLEKGLIVHFLGMVHTPLVPFTVDQVQAACGVMITASHNPAADNGYKVYWENGCQIIPPHDIGIAKCINNNFVGAKKVPDDFYKLPGLKTGISDSLISSYFETMNQKLLSNNFRQYPNNGKVFPKFVYTPIHGVGLPYMKRAAKMLGVSDSMIIVDEQAKPDPDFPTVRFPNPEEKGALDLAISTAERDKAEIILANDPDADRFAVAVKNSRTGEWHQFTGNETGTLFADYILQSYKSEKPDKMKKMALLNSTVSSQVIKYLAENESIRYEETLTGFKWIGNRAIDLEREGYVVPFAYEEALGYMFSVVHDKDGISAAFVYLQMLLDLKHEDPLNVLDKIYCQVGYFEEKNGYYISQTPELTKQVFDSIRTTGSTHYPNSVGHFIITSWRDLTTGYDSTTPDNKPILPVSSSSQMITCTAKDSKDSNKSVRFTLRGSGTEPKLKVYIEARANSLNSAKDCANEMWNVLKREWFKPEVTGLRTTR